MLATVKKLKFCYVLANVGEAEGLKGVKVGAAVGAMAGIGVGQFPPHILERSELNQLSAGSDPGRPVVNSNAQYGGGWIECR